MDTTFDMFIETEVPEEELIISRTDLRGIITYVNDTFAHISGYTAEELIGKPHSIVRHPDMPRSIFKELWETIGAQKEWSGYVKNLRKDKGYYWVYAEISGVYREGKLVEYKSMRHPVAREKKIQMQRLYDRMRLAEEKSARSVCYLSAESVEKIRSLAAYNKIEEDTLLDTIISTYQA